MKNSNREKKFTRQDQSPLRIGIVHFHRFAVHSVYAFGQGGQSELQCSNHVYLGGAHISPGLVALGYVAVGVSQLVQSGGEERLTPGMFSVRGVTVTMFTL